MQWLINIVLESLKGIVVQWSGAIVNIPTGWHLCDGTSGTLDLRDKFIVGAGDGYAVGATGGAVTHNHPFTSSLHRHHVTEGDMIQEGTGYAEATTDVAVTGTTDAADGRPPYYALAYIQKV